MSGRVKGTADVNLNKVELPSKTISRRAYGEPAKLSKSAKTSAKDAAGFKRVIAGAENVLSLPEKVCKHLKILIETQGVETANSLPRNILEHLNDTIGTYQRAGYPKDVLDGMRLCVAQKIKEQLEA